MNPISPGVGRGTPHHGRADARPLKGSMSEEKKPIARLVVQAAGTPEEFHVIHVEGAGPFVPAVELRIGQAQAVADLVNRLVKLGNALGGAK